MARALESTHITFGLVSVPIKVYTAAKSSNISFNRLHPTTLNRTKQLIVDAVTNHPVKQNDCKRGFEYEKGKKGEHGKSIEITDAELDTISEASQKGIDIKEFISCNDLPILAVDKSYYVGPAPGGEKAFSLLSSVLEDKAVIAIAQWTTRGRTKLVAIRPYRDGVKGLLIQDLYYSDEIRPFNEVGVMNTLDCHQAEIQMAGQLVEMLFNKSFDFSAYKNKYADKLCQLVENKIAGKTLDVTNDSTPSTMDLFDALKASLGKNVKAA